ncbi:FkbM family methyltransferase [Chroococcidiopsidales cyanobacterium LEGE 13417]|nr:FkbM family methyltransferase [Chroococcidiopsidales cyanobacterium LEGE 13417]
MMGKTLKKLISTPFRNMHKQQANDFDLPQATISSSHVKQLIAQANEGLFTFDVRDKAVGWRIALEGVWEESETNFIKTIVREGDFAIDVGANLGWYTITLANLVGKDGFILAFEPNPRNHHLLLENIRLNQVENQVRTYQSALLDSKSTVSFELSESNFGDHRVRFRHFNSKEVEKYNESSRSVITVEAITLDEILADNLEKNKVVRLMKLDCQGSEVAILRGAHKTLEKIEYLVTEYWPYGIRRAGYEPSNFIQIVKSSFTSFAEVPKRNEVFYSNFKPISEFDAHIKTEFGADEKTSTKVTDYIFRK